ncbi:hypothetical protein MBLNU459_g0809t2 [Dothideomycetes sp. NU459]
MSKSAVFLAALDITIVSTALPTIAEYYQSSSGYTWIGSTFLLAAAVVAPSWGKFSDIWGRKPVLLVAVSIFFLGSTICGAAVNIEMLITGRAVQGAAGGGLMSLVSIVVGDSFSQRDRGKYYGFVGMIWAVAFVLGPLIGGAFTENISWRWCFYINLPISGTSFFVILFMLKLETPKTPLLAGMKIVDWTGSLALIGGLLMLLLGLVFGGVTFPWGSSVVICLIVFGVLTIVIFAFVERYVARYPLVPVHLYANIANASILIIDLFHGIVLTANTYFLPLYCQSVLGASPILSGVLLLPFAFFMSVALVGSGNFIKKTGRYFEAIAFGFALMTLGTGLYYDLPDGRYWPKIILYQIVSGFGVGLNFQPPLIALQNNVPAQDNGSATASFGLTRNVASAIGVAIGSVIFSNDMNSQHSKLVEALGAESAAMFTGADAQANVLRIGDFTPEQQRIIRQAFGTAIRTIWIVAVAFSAASFLVCFFVPRKVLGNVHVRVNTGLAGEEERRRIVMEQRAVKNQGLLESA